MVKLLLLLKNKWQEENVYYSGTTEYQIKVLEHRIKFSMPADFKEYILTMNGMYPFSPSFMDSKGFFFYQIQDIDFVATVSADNSIKFLCFASYMDRSWSYCFRIDYNKNIYSIVLYYGGNDYVVIAESFSEFLWLYLEDSEKLYDF